ncbi:MAG: hypothetical protein WC378_05515 [Opitutaceae bacterium]
MTDPVACPFCYGAPLTHENAHIPRPDIQARIRTNAETHSRVVLFGERRIGKSSLPALALGQAPVLPLLTIDLREIASVSDYVDRCRRVLQSCPFKPTKLTVQSLWKDFTEAVKSISAPGFSVEFRHEPPDFEDFHRVMESFDLLGKSIPNLTIVFDEFQDVRRLEPKSIAKSFIARLRDAIQRHRNTAYIFTGSHSAELSTIFLSHSSSFYQQAIPCNVRNFSTAEYVRFLSEQFALGRRSLAPELASSFLSVAGAIPNDVQHLAYHVWSLSVAGRPVTPQIIKRALRQLLDDQEQRLSLRLSYTSQLQTRLLYALAGIHSGSARYQTRNFVQSVGAVSRQSVAQAVAALAKDEREEDDPALVVREGVVSFRDRWLHLGLLRRILRQPSVLPLHGISQPPAPVEPSLAEYLGIIFLEIHGQTVVTAQTELKKTTPSE